MGQREMHIGLAHLGDDMDLASGSILARGGHAARHILEAGPGDMAQDILLVLEMFIGRRRRHAGQFAGFRDRKIRRPVALDQLPHRRDQRLAQVAVMVRVLAANLVFFRHPVILSFQASVEKLEK